MFPVKRQALDKALEKIEHEFTLSRVVVLEDCWVNRLGGFQKGFVRAGWYMVGVEKWNPDALEMEQLAPLTAHHLRCIGKAHLYYQSGKFEKARVFA